MIAQLRQNWWIPALRGALAILFGILAFVWPVATAYAFVIIIAAFAFIEGIFAFVAAFGWGLPGAQRFLLVLMGLFGLAVGVCAVFYPTVLALTLVLLVAWWAIVTGVIQLVVSIEMRKSIPNDWLFVLSGIISVAFGVLLIWRPYAGVLTLAYLFGFYALLYGIMLLGLSFRLRSLPAAA
ncbi:MAG TPA: DUF308 domain-containing protein [Candidatus Acidoferrales bacterium]|nr:DUF308 domain-containing protein [Candidatus Acidoferrales bacterium]